MVWKLAKRTLIATAAIAILAGAWQVMAGSGAKAIGRVEKSDHGDD